MLRVCLGSVTNWVRFFIRVSAKIGFVFSSAFWGVCQDPWGHGKSDYELRMGN